MKNMILVWLASFSGSKSKDSKALVSEEKGERNPKLIKFEGNRKEKGRRVGFGASKE